MNQMQLKKEEHRIAEKIRSAMRFVAEKANDIKRCSDYTIADEAADMLEYVKDEIDDTLDIVARAKDNGLFCNEYGDDDCESLEEIRGSAEDDCE